jgi:hypothetical protein
LTELINLDRFNLFLLGLNYYGAKMLYQILAGLIQVYNLICGIACILTIRMLHYRQRRKKKPPDKSISESISMVACSSGREHSIDNLET